MRRSSGQVYDGSGTFFRGHKLRYLLLLLIGIQFTGCNMHDVLDAIAGHKYDVVILSKDPLVLGKDLLILRASHPMKVIGATSHVCLVLKDKVGTDSNSDELFKTAMNGSTVNISVELTSGATLKFSEPMPAWSRDGRILESGEFSACASPCCEDKARLAKGSEVKEVRIVSSKPLKIRGVFWESNNVFDDLEKK